MEINEILILVKESFSIADMGLKIYGYNNKYTYDKIKKMIEDNNIDISHFGGALKIESM